MTLKKFPSQEILPIFLSTKTRPLKNNHLEKRNKKFRRMAIISVTNNKLPRKSTKIKDYNNIMMMIFKSTFLKNKEKSKRSKKIF
jgi:hypothetical protein